MQRQRATTDHRYTDEEVGEIIRLASRLDDRTMGAPDAGLSASEVRRIASELGIAESAVTEAMARHSKDVRRDRRLSMFRSFWRATLQAHLFVYLTTLAGIGAVDLISGGGLDFVQYPAAVWGVLVAWHAGLTWLVDRR